MSNPPKLSAAKSVHFRPGDWLRQQLERLDLELGGDRISEIVRIGLTMHWPEIQATFACGGPAVISMTDAEVTELRAFLSDARRARALGIDPRRALADAVAAAAR